MEVKGLFEFARTAGIFSALSDQELEELLGIIEMSSFKAGEIVFSRGDAGDRFYIVLNGKIRIIRMGENNKELNLALLTRGDHFGETAIITQHPRNATARATEDSVLLSISSDVFNEYLFSRPNLRGYFDRFIHSTSINHFLKTCSDLSTLAPQDLQKLALNFQPDFFKAGEVIIRQGTEADCFYLLESGKVKVLQWKNNKEEIVRVLHEGQFFGEKALIEDTPRTADVVCITDCNLFRLDREQFIKMVGESARLKSVLLDRIQSYARQDRPPIPYQEVIKQIEASQKNRLIADAEPEEKKARPSAGQSRSRILKAPLLRRTLLGFPYIQQHDEMSCGITCLSMIFRYYGKSFSSSRLWDMARVDQNGTSLANMAMCAEQFGFITKGLKLDYEGLQSQHLPCIALWTGFHYVVVYKISSHHVWVADPARGLRKYSRDQFMKCWNNIALVLEPTEKFRQVKEDRTSFQNFVQFITPYRMIFFEIFTASLLINIFGLATPIFTQNIIDNVLLNQNMSLLKIMLIGMVVVVIFRILTMIVRQYLIVHTSMKIDLKMLVLFYKHLLTLPLGYFKTRKIGDFITRFGENAKIRDFLTNTILSLVLDVIMVVVYTSLMFYYNTRLSLVFLLFFPLGLGATFIFTPLLKRLNVDSFSARAESESHLIESLHSIDTIKAMSIEGPVRWRWENKFIKSLNLDFRLANARLYFTVLGDFISFMSSIVILWLGALQVTENALSIGALMAFNSLAGSVTAPLNRIISVWESIQQTVVSIDRLNDVFSAVPEMPHSVEDSPGLLMKDTKGEISFEKVFFRYGGADDPYILSNISFRILPGQKVAIVGRSGSGKTTMVKLIARFYDVTDGKISIDNNDIKSISLSSLRRHIGFVLQENYIYNATIRENISMWDSEERMEKVIEAAKLANAHDFITGLGMGYETRVGESGIQLSGGQKQRIAIARALYQNPAILVLDEATSSLDSESEKAIQKNLESILHDRTALIIAHRLSTVKNCDLIIVLDNGEIVEQGTHQSLMSEKGLYHYLVHQQLNL